jgi:hypothetical protein
MKAIFLTLSVSVMASTALAADYDSLLAKQTQLEVTGISKPGRAVAGLGVDICASIGYNRVVSSKTEACTPGETMYFTQSAGGAVSELLSNVQGHVVCGINYADRLASVVCAK